MDLHIPDQGHSPRPEKVNYRLLWRLLKYVWPYRWKVLAAFFMMVLATLATLAGPYLIKLAIDTAILEPDLERLTFLAVLLLGSYLVNWMASFGQNFLMSLVGQQVIFNLRQALFGHLQGLSFSYFDRHATGKIMSRVINDIEALNDFISWGIVHLAGDIMMLGGIMVVMFWEHPGLALLGLATFPFFLVISTLFRNRVIEAYRQVRNRIADINQDLQENISAFKIVQGFAREEKNMQEFSRINQENLEANLRAAGLFAVYLPLIEVVGAAGTALLLWYGGNEVLRGGIQVGTLYLFLDYLSRFYAPLRDLSQIYNNLQSSLAASEKFFEVMDTAPGVVDVPGARELPPLEGRVEFQGVSFAYEEDKPVLDRVSFTVEPGEMVALVGPTGAGKTTLVNLLCRFYEPGEGRILVDGHDLGEVKVGSLRSQLGLVLQDPFLFSGTLADNIRYGCPGASQEEVEAAARAVHLDRYIQSLPGGYRSPVGERGGNLSMGQRQLVSFARVILRDPRLLILDEATSSVDTATEQSIQGALGTVTAGRTSLVIAHRLSTIRKAHKILVVDRGRIVQRGTHQELVDVEGLYRELIRMQEAEGLPGPLPDYLARVYS